jgi:hypothetical protein
MKYQVVRDADGNLVAVVPAELEKLNEDLVGDADRAGPEAAPGFGLVLAHDQEAIEVTVEDEYRTLAPDELFARIRNDIGQPRKSQ